MKIRYFISSIIFILICSSSIFADSKSSFGVVNFMTCLTESKYGKSEQKQLENIKKQWSSLIEETEKELGDVNAKFEDQDYLDGLSPEAEEELKMKQNTLNQDLAKYQNQLYQILNQANYFFIQKMTANISKASETIAKKNKLDLVLNKEACFYNNPRNDIDITDLVIKQMDKNYDQEMAENEKAQKDNDKNIADSKQVTEKNEQKK